MEGRSTVERRCPGGRIERQSAQRRPPSELLPLCAALGLALAAPAMAGTPKPDPANCSARFPRVECLARPAPGSAAPRQVLKLRPSQPASHAKTVTPGEQAEPRAGEARPLNRDELFGGGGEAGGAAAQPDAPSSREALFGGDASAPAPKPPAVRGFVQFEPAYTYASPGHWSRGVVRTQAEVQGELNASAKWKASLRLDVDPVYYATDFYPDPVQEDQQLELLVRETYLDLSLPRSWELRLGRQHIVWGEVVGLFFADVVSARDLRDFILPDFEILRIPQWAARAEWFGKDTHFELLWIPFPSFDDVGKQGAEFYPFVIPDTPGFTQVVLDDNRPDSSLDNTNYGVRLSHLIGGWDLSGFYYRSTSAAPTLYRDVLLAPTPTVVFEPRHDRIWQAGATLGKDLRSFVLKAEAVYTDGRRFEVDDARPSGVVEQDTLDYIVGLDFMLPMEGRLNLQAFQRIYFDHDPAILFDEVESGVSLLVSVKPTPKIEPQLLVIQSLNSNDRMLRPRVTWYAGRNLRAAVGVDIFAGPATGLFGRFGDSDRVYGEVRYSF